MSSDGFGNPYGDEKVPRWREYNGSYLRFADARCGIGEAMNLSAAIDLARRPNDRFWDVAVIG